jgi:transposase
MRVAPAIALTDAQRSELESLASGRRTEVRVSERARIILQAAEGRQNKQIAEQLGVDRLTAALWRRRYVEWGVAGILKDAPRAGRRRTVLTPTKAAEIVAKTTQEKPAGATHWSCRTMAKVVGVSEASVRRVWHEHGLKPHLIKTFKVSNDPQFCEKLEDIIGLYVNPPEHALVLCCDEKSQIQALDRTQQVLPLKKGRCGTMTHDYTRHGTTTLFAALNVLDGSVHGTCMPKHRHQEWIKFLAMLDRDTPADRTVHLIADNYATHKHPRVKRWMAKHPRFQIHFTPTSASWLNMVERFFRDLTTKRLRRDSFDSVENLIKAIQDYIATHNKAPKPFIWTAKATDILEKVKRARTTLDKLATD